MTDEQAGVRLAEYSWACHQVIRQHFLAQLYRQWFTLNQRAHLLSAELRITPKDALDRLQGYD